MSKKNLILISISIYRLNFFDLIRSKSNKLDDVDDCIQH